MLDVYVSKVLRKVTLISTAARNFSLSFHFISIFTKPFLQPLRFAKPFPYRLGESLPHHLYLCLSLFPMLDEKSLTQLTPNAALIWGFALRLLLSSTP